MWIPEVSLGNATFQEPVQDVEKVPKTRWKLVSTNRYIDLRQVADINDSRVTSANKRWVPAFNVGTNRASRHSTSPALGGRDYVCA